MPRRNLVPVAILAVLAVLTLLFAILGASSAPSGATVAVQNASVETFGSPTGSNSFAMDVVSSVSAGAGTGAITQVRLVGYVPPARMAVYQVVGSRTRLIGVLDPTAIDCALSAYTAVVSGSTPWTLTGSTYTRTESLAAYSSRMPRPSGSSCEPKPSSVQGQVHERAAVRSGYLVGVHLTVDVPAQKLSNGRQAVHGDESEALVLLRIKGIPTRSLGS